MERVRFNCPVCRKAFMVPAERASRSMCSACLAVHQTTENTSVVQPVVRVGFDEESPQHHVQQSVQHEAIIETESDEVLSNPEENRATLQPVNDSDYGTMFWCAVHFPAIGILLFVLAGCLAMIGLIVFQQSGRPKDQGSFPTQGFLLVLIISSAILSVVSGLFLRLMSDVIIMSFRVARDIRTISGRQR